MKLIKTESLDHMIEKGTAYKHSIVKLIIVLVYISKKGILYKQLRGRHTFLGENGYPIFIDFGGSIKTSHMRALIYNICTACNNI